MCRITTHHEVFEPKVELIDQQQREIDHLSALLGTTGGGVFYIICFLDFGKITFEVKCSHLHPKRDLHLNVALHITGEPCLVEGKVL